jgi:hypothetical protein
MACTCSLLLNPALQQLQQTGDDDLEKQLMVVFIILFSTATCV